MDAGFVLVSEAQVEGEPGTNPVVVLQIYRLVCSGVSKPRRNNELTGRRVTL